MISQSPEVILFGSINPIKYSFKKLFEINSDASCKNSKPLLFSVPIFNIPILGFDFY